MVKIIKEKLEEARVKVRGIREELKKEIEKSAKEGEFGKDEEEKYLEELQSLVNSANQELESIYNKKKKRYFRRINNFFYYIYVFCVRI